MSHTQLSLFRADEPSPTTDPCQLLKDAVQSAIYELEKCEKTLGERLQDLQNCVDKTVFCEAVKTWQGIVGLTTDLKDELSIQITQQAVAE
jgi:hypothetical protein